MIGKLLRDPLLHFVVIGAAMFAVYAVMNSASPDKPLTIAVTEADLARIDQSFEATWRRPPNDDERQNLIDGFIRQEVMVREAEALGLEKDDPVIRQRLSQKMEFLLSSGANALTPSDEELQAWLADNADRFRVSGETAFEQVYLGESLSQDDLDAVQAALSDGGDLRSLGKRTLLPSDVPLSHPIAIDSTFGAGFAGSLRDLPLNQWAGPVLSGYGVHLVRITDRTEPRLPPLEDIRDRVESGWRADRAEALAESLYEDLKARYTVEVEGGA